MSTALNGTFHAGGAKPYEALELRQPFPGFERQREDFEFWLRRLGRPVGEDERTAMWTLYRLGRYDEWLAERAQRATEIGQEMAR